MKNKMLTLALLSSFISLNAEAAQEESLDDLLSSFISTPTKLATTQPSLLSSVIIDETKKDSTSSSSGASGGATPVKKPVVSLQITRLAQLEEEIKQLKAAGDAKALKLELDQLRSSGDPVALTQQLQLTEQARQKLEAQLKEADKEKKKALREQKEQLEQHEKDELDKQNKTYTLQLQQELAKQEKSLNKIKAKELADQEARLEKEKKDELKQSEVEAKKKVATTLKTLADQRDDAIKLYGELRAEAIGCLKIVAGFITNQKPEDIKNEEVLGLLAKQKYAIVDTDGATVREEVDVEVPQNFVDLINHDFNAKK
jgi:chromosome segregation ATPase